MSEQEVATTPEERTVIVIGDKLAQAILDQDTDGFDRNEYILKLAKEFKAKTKGDS